MIVERLFSILLTLLLGSWFVIGDSVQGETLLSINNPASQSQHPYSQTLASGTNRTSKPKGLCLNIRRLLNPSATPQPSETVLGRYFRLAYNAEVAGDFNTAIVNYSKAAKQATCDCDRLYAQAGEQAAQEAKELLKTEGKASKPTQFFWGRLQELTKSLSCVTTQ